MEISVIIPTYKPGKYLWECLDSLYNQTLSRDKFETIVILNGCCDPWEKQINTWIADHSELNIYLIQTDKPGVCNARNTGIKLAKGKYISFIDDDDYISPTFLNDLLVEASPDTVVLSDSISFIDKTGEFDQNYSLHKVFKSLSNSNKIDLFHARSIFNGPCMKLLDSNLIHKTIFNESFTNGEDSLFMFEISKNIKHISLAAPSAVYYRRIRENSATTYNKPKFYAITNNFKLILEYSKCFIKAPFAYNISFYISRVLAGFKNMFTD